MKLKGRAETRFSGRTQLFGNMMRAYFVSEADMSNLSFCKELYYRVQQYIRGGEAGIIRPTHILIERGGVNYQIHSISVGENREYILSTFDKVDGIAPGSWALTTSSISWAGYKAMSQHVLYYAATATTDEETGNVSVVLSEQEERKAGNLKVIEYLVSLGIEANKEPVKCIVSLSEEEEGPLVIEALCQYSGGGILLTGVCQPYISFGYELFVDYAPNDDGAFNYFGQIYMAQVARLNENGKLDSYDLEDKSIDESKLSDDVIEKFYDPTLYCTITKDSSGVLSLSATDDQATENIKNIKRIQPSLTEEVITASPRLTFVYGDVVFNVDPTTTAFLFLGNNYYPKCTGQFVFEGVAYDYSIVFNYRTGVIYSATLTKKISNVNTPSGHPLHDAFVMAGGVWTPYDELPVDLQNDESLENGGYWSYRADQGGLKDITTDEFLKAYLFDPILSVSAINEGQWAIMGGNRINCPRFNICNATAAFANDLTFVAGGVNNEDYTKLEVLFLSYGSYCYANNLALFCNNNLSLKRIYGTIYINSISSSDKVTGAFKNCENLESVFLHSLKVNVSFADCPKLLNECILFMINNVSSLASGIVLTLHSEAYARAMADEEIVAALETHTNITLASA